MQVFIIGSALETAQALDKKRLNKQIIECKQILNAINGKTKAWTNHPCTIQYKNHINWLIAYANCLESYFKNDIHKARIWNLYAMDLTPNFHTSMYLEQMKRRLYTKDNNHYNRWRFLGESQENWYWSTKENRFIKYINGKKLK